MSTTFPPPALPGFVTLSPQVSLLTRTSSSPSSSSSHPSLIILCSWMGAADRHISKYTTEYAKLYPSTSILLIKCGKKDIFWRSEVDIWRQLNPALQVVISEAEKGQESSGGKENIALVAFSNGGSFMATHLAALYRSRTGKPLPVKSTVLDSTPGALSLKSGIKPLMVGLPKIISGGLVGYVTAFVIGALLLIAVYSQEIFLSKPHPVKSLRKRLNTPTLIPISSRRLYIFSKEDELVDYRAVVKHAREAEELGWSVAVEEFAGTKHVAHVMGKHGERYWSVARECIEGREEE